MNKRVQALISSIALIAAISLCLSMQDAYSARAAGDSAVALVPPARPIGKDLFCLNLIGLNYNAAWPSFPFFAWRNFNSYWDKLESQKGNWNFATLDKEIALAEKHNVEVMLVLGSTPTWASARPNEKGCCSQSAPKGNAAEAKNINDWRNYVRTVATRYKGRVRRYEMWNEPNSPSFYTGSVAKLVELNREAYKVLKEVDPTIIVVSSSLSRCCNPMKFLDEYLAQGGGNYADAIGYHFYPAPEPPEAMLPKIYELRSLLNRHGVKKPIWNTETGWRVINHDRNVETETWAGPPLSDEESSAYLARTYILTWNYGVERLYWYAWGHASMGMTEANLNTPKQIAKTYEVLQAWLVGARMKSLKIDAEGSYICPLTRADGRNAWIVWNPDRTVQFAVPRDWNVSRWSDLLGRAHPINQARSVSVNMSPIMLER